MAEVELKEKVCYIQPIEEDLESKDYSLHRWRDPQGAE